MRVRALSLLSREEKGEGDDDGGGGEASSQSETTNNGAAAVEFDIQIGSRFTPAVLAHVLKPHCDAPDDNKQNVFSRAGLWRGPLSALPQSFPLQLPSSLSVLEIVLLPEEDDGSLDLSLARAQLSVPLLSERAQHRGAATPSTSATAAPSSQSAGPESSSAPAAPSDFSTIAEAGGDGEVSPAIIPPGESSAGEGSSGVGEGHVAAGGTDDIVNGADANEHATNPSSSVTATATAFLAGICNTDFGFPSTPCEEQEASAAPSAVSTNGAPESGADVDMKTDFGASATEEAVVNATSRTERILAKEVETEPTGNRDRAAGAAVPVWGLDTDVVAILETEKGKDPSRSGRLHEEQRRQLARDALRTGDADRLLLCLGRLEGEAPRVVGGRADRYDDPIAVEDRARRRKEKEQGRRPVRDDAAEAPIWAPPFPPEEYDDYDDGAGMGTQDFGSGAGATHPYQSERAAGGSRICRGGQQPSADLLEALRRLLRALSYGNAAADTQHPEVKMKNEGVIDNKDSTGVQGGKPKADEYAETPARQEEGLRELRDVELRGSEKSAEKDDGDDYSLASAVLEGSCLRSVCRQYMFGVDWRFVSAHRRFYRALLLLLKDTLTPALFDGDSTRLPPATEAQQAGPTPRGPLARSLLAASIDCPGLVDLLGSLCVALEDLVACPPQAPAPLPPPPTPLPTPASPEVTHPPPSPASPHSTLAQLAQAPATAAAAAAAASATAYFASFASPGLAQNTVPPTPVAAASTGKQKAAGVAASPQDTSTAYVPASAGVIPSSPASILVNADPFAPSISTPTSPPSVGCTSTPPYQLDDLPPLAPAHGHAHSNSDEAITTTTASAAAEGDAASTGDGAAPAQQSQPAMALPPLPPVPQPSSASLKTTGISTPAVDVHLLAQTFPPASALPPSPIPTPPPLPPVPPPSSVSLKATRISTLAADVHLLAQILAPASQLHPPPTLTPTPAMGIMKPVNAAARAAEELARATQHEKEKREHEEGLELTAIARAVLEQAKAVRDTTASHVKSAEQTTAPATLTVTAGEGEGSACSAPDGYARNGHCVSVERGGGVDESKRGGPAAAAAGGVSARLAEDECQPSAEELYVEAMAAEQFGTMRMETSKSAGSSNGKPEQQHHFWRVAAAEGPAPPARQRRLVRELRSLARELPLYWGSTVAVRVDEDRPHLLKAMIAAPGGTPYDSGLFQFDIYCPPQYPNVPPRVNLMTTGRGTVRFNPNLYPCGNVCLSLLGTWSGSPEMMWSPDASLLQVLLSIQTFILGAQYPYFNEPGLELDFGNPGSMDRARTSPNGGYELLRPATVEWAMTEALRKPPRGFENLAREHLWRKKWHILEVVADWLREGRAPGGLSGHYRELVAGLEGFVRELIQLSKTAGKCPFRPPRPSIHSRRRTTNTRPTASRDGCTDSEGDGTENFDTERAEFLAAMRGLFGPEAGPPDPPASRPQPASKKKKAASASSYNTKVKGLGGGGREGEGEETKEGSGGGGATVAGGTDSNTSTATPAKASTTTAATTAKAAAPATNGTVNANNTTCASPAVSVDTQDRGGGGGGGGKSTRDTQKHETGEEEERLRNYRRRWETPEEARDRLQFRLQIITRRLDVAIASSAAGPPRRLPVEPWGVAAGKVARAAGVGSLHGKALAADEAIAGGKPGVTWSTHPHFRKYFLLLRLGIPEEEVVAAAKRNGVDPCILERGDEEIPLSTQYAVVSACAPLLRVSPDLASTPVAQLTPSSGIIYTADPSRAFWRAGSAGAAAATAAPTPADEASVATGADSVDVGNSAVGKSTDNVAVAGAAGEVPPSPTSSSSLPGHGIATASPAPVDAAEMAAAVAAAETTAVYEQAVPPVPCEPCDAHAHPLVLSGRRVWVVSPVVGWASVWNETGQKILRPAAEMEAEERARREKASAEARDGAGKAEKGGKGKKKGKGKAPQIGSDFTFGNWVQGIIGEPEVGGKGVGGGEEQGEDDEQDGYGQWGDGLKAADILGVGNVISGFDKVTKSLLEADGQSAAKSTGGLSVLQHSAANDGGPKTSKKTAGAKPDAWSLAPESSALPAAAMQEQLAGQPAPTATNGKKQQSLLSWLSAQHSAPGAPSQSVGAATTAPTAPHAAAGGESQADSLSCSSPEEQSPSVPPAPAATAATTSTDDCASNDTVAASADTRFAGASSAPGLAAESATGSGADLAAVASGAIGTTTAVMMSPPPPPPCILLESTSDSSCPPKPSLPFEGASGDVDTSNHSGGGGSSSFAGVGGGGGGGGVGHVQGEAQGTSVGGGTTAMNVDEEEKKTE